jgi:hypothetical protein
VGGKKEKKKKRSEKYTWATGWPVERVEGDGGSYTVS